MESQESKAGVLHYILDPSALVYGGIGKIKQWIELTNDNNNNSTKIKIVFYVPSYTLKELDFLKKVFNPLISANARESIKFIDNQISDINFNNDHNDGIDSDNSIYDSDLDAVISDYNSDDNDNDDNDNDYTDFESYNKLKSIKKNLKINNNDNNTNNNKISLNVKPVTFILEHDQNIGPDWKIASGFRRYTPLLSDLPKPINGYSSKGQMINDDNRKYTVGVFGNNIPGSFNMSKNSNNSYENNNNNNNNTNTNDDEKAVVPLRLKFLIRSCIQKQYIENKNKNENKKINWDIICEDSTTSIWLKSFGLSVKSLNEIQPIFDQYLNNKPTKVLYDPNTGKLVETNSNIISSSSSNTYNSKTTKAALKNNYKKFNKSKRLNNKNKKNDINTSNSQEEQDDLKINQIVKNVENIQINSTEESNEKSEKAGNEHDEKKKKKKNLKKTKKKNAKDEKKDDVDNVDNTTSSKPNKKKGHKTKTVQLENTTSEKDQGTVRLITADSFAERRTGGDLWVP